MSILLGLPGLPAHSMALIVVIPITCDSLGNCSGFPTYDPSAMLNSPLQQFDSYQLLSSEQQPGGDTVYNFTPGGSSCSADGGDSGADGIDDTAPVHSIFDGDGDTSYNLTDLTQEQRDDEMFNARNDSIDDSL